MSKKLFQPNEKIRKKFGLDASRLWINKETLMNRLGCLENEVLEITDGEIENPIFSIDHENEIAKWTWGSVEMEEDDVLSPVPGSKVGSKVFCLGDKTILAIKTPKRIVLKFFNKTAQSADYLYDSNLYDIWVYEENDEAFAE